MLDLSKILLLMQWTLDELAVFLISAGISGIIIPKILLIAFRKRLFDEPDERKIHTAAVPRLGGLAFMPSIVFSICLVMGVKGILDMQGLSAYFGGPSDGAGDMSGMLLPMCFGLCAVMMMYLVGIADDLIGVRYRAKFVAQILAALLLAMGGVRIENFHGFMWLYELPVGLSWAATVLLVVFITNAINLIDGIDGLASGLSGIAMAFYGFVFMHTGHMLYAMLAFAGLGTLVPFFYYNVFGNPAMGKKIFMGDTGSLTTGLILSFLSIEVCSLPEGSVYSWDVMVVAFAPLAIPCLDVIRVFVHRIVRGMSPFLPDKSHIHHKLLALGIPQRWAMTTILATSSALIAANLLMSVHMGPMWVLVIDMAVWVVVNWQLTRCIMARQKRLGIKEGYK